jgi:hypothetical protein
MDWIIIKSVVHTQILIWRRKTYERENRDHLTKEQHKGPSRIVTIAAKTQNQQLMLPRHSAQPIRTDTAHTNEFAFNGISCGRINLAVLIIAVFPPKSLSRVSRRFNVRIQHGRASIAALSSIEYSIYGLQLRLEIGQVRNPQDLMASQIPCPHHP